MERKSWYVYPAHGFYFVVDEIDGRPVRTAPASSRDVAQATLHGVMRSSRKPAETWLGVAA